MVVPFVIPSVHRFSLACCLLNPHCLQNPFVHRIAPLTQAAATEAIPPPVSQHKTTDPAIATAAAHEPMTAEQTEQPPVAATGAADATASAPAPVMESSEVPQSSETKSKPEVPAKSEKLKSNAGKEDAAKPDVAAATEGEGKKLTGAELKAKAKAEKAARRAQAKSTKVDQVKGEAAVSSSPVQLGPSAAEVKASKGKGRPDGAAGAASKHAGSKGAAPVAAAPVEPKNIIPECFSHLSMARRLPMTQADKDVHPTILALGQQMATFAIDESILRLRATLLAFKKVITSYNTPPGNTLARHLTPHVLNPQIEYLTACRPMCFSMGNAIRWLKLQVSKIDPDVAEHVAKKQLCESIDNFIQERITMADVVITEQAGKKIRDGDVILVHGRTTIIERTLLGTFKDGKKFSVFVIDDPYTQTGQALAKTLTEAGIKVTYCGDFGGLRSHVQQASKILLSAESMFNNGSMYGRSGSCDIAIAAKEVGKPVIALCETINITERVTTDSLTYNEIDPERSSAAAFRLLFDTTPAQYLAMVITELGSVQPTSVSDLLRKLEESN